MFLSASPESDGSIQSATEPDSLSYGYEQRGGDLLRQFEHPQTIACCNRTQTDFVLVMALGRTREHRGRHGQLERFRSPCRSADLQRLEPMIDRGTRPLSPRQVGRQPIAVAAVDQQCHLPVKQIRQVSDGIFHAVHGKRDMPAVKVTAIQDTFGLPHR